MATANCDPCNGLGPLSDGAVQKVTIVDCGLSSASGPDIELLILCDPDNTSNPVLVTITDGDVAGAVFTNVDGSPYLGNPPINCPIDIEEVATCYEVVTAGVGYNIGDRLTEIKFFDTSTNPPTLFAVVWFNQNTSIVIATPNIVDLTECNAVSNRDLLCFRSLVEHELSLTVDIGAAGINGVIFTSTLDGIPAESVIVDWGDGDIQSYIAGDPIGKIYTVDEPAPYEIRITTTNGGASVTDYLIVTEAGGSFVNQQVLFTHHVSYEVWREGEAGAETWTRCFDNLVIPEPAVIVKCEHPIVPTREVFNETCYKEKNLVRVDWNDIQVWDITNPTLVDFLDDIVNGGTGILRNIMLLGVDVTYAFSGTSQTATVVNAGESIQIGMIADTPVQLNFSYSQDVSIVQALGNLEQGQSSTWQSDIGSKLKLIANPNVVGASLSQVSGQGSDFITHTDINGNLDPTWLFANDIRTLDMGLDPGSIFDAMIFGIWIAIDNTETVYKEIRYTDNSTTVVNVNDPTDVLPNIGTPWEPISCNEPIEVITRERSITRRRCYENKFTDTNSFLINWNDLQVWDAGNPTPAQFTGNLILGIPMTINNVMESGLTLDVLTLPFSINNATLSPDGTGVTIEVLDTITGSVSMEFSQPVCIMNQVSDLSIDEFFIWAGNATDVINVTDDPEQENSQLYTITGNGTDNVQHGEVPLAGLPTSSVAITDSNILASSFVNQSGATQDIDLSWTFNPTGQAEYYHHLFYDDGTDVLVNVNEPNDIKFDIELGWQEIDCSQVQFSSGSSGGAVGNLTTTVEILDDLSPITTFLANTLNSFAINVLTGSMTLNGVLLPVGTILSYASNDSINNIATAQIIDNISAGGQVLVTTTSYI